MADSRELWRPSFALWKTRLQSLGYGFLQRHPCPLFRNEGYLSSSGEPRFQLTCQPLCRTCGDSISYETSALSGSHLILPQACLSRAIARNAKLRYDDNDFLCRRQFPPRCRKIIRALCTAELLCRKTHLATSL